AEAGLQQAAEHAVAQPLTARVGDVHPRAPLFGAWELHQELVDEAALARAVGPNQGDRTHAPGGGSLAISLAQVLQLSVAPDQAGAQVTWREQAGIRVSHCGEESCT